MCVGYTPGSIYYCDAYNPRPESLVGTVSLFLSAEEQPKKVTHPKQSNQFLPTIVTTMRSIGRMVYLPA